MLTDEERWAVANNFYTAIMNDMGTGTWRVMIMDYLKRIEEDALKDAAKRIRAAVDEWEASGDDEKMVNEVIDPWLIEVLDKEN